MYYQFNPDKLPHISYMGLSSNTAPYIHPRRTTGEYLMFIMKSGTFHINENHQNYCLQTGDVLILDPDAMHCGTQPSLDERYYIHLNPSVFTPVFIANDENLRNLLIANRQLTYDTQPFSQDMYSKSSLLLPKYMHIDDPAVRRKVDLAMTQAIFASEHRNEHYKLTCSVCFMQILITLAQYFSAKTLSVTNENFTAAQQRVLSELMDYLHTNYVHKLTSIDLENHFQMNFDYLNRLFKKKNGTPIFNYLNTVRINKAVEMLIGGNTKSCEIASAVGFSDEYYFSKAFKKYMGISPKNYLKLNQ